MREKVLAHLRENEEKYLEQMFDLLRIPSISTKPENAEDVKATAEWIAADCKRIGLEHIQVIPTERHPLVYADWLHAGDDKPTILVYGHYDVQPVDPIELWDSPPFEPEIRDGEIYARGSSDDKGQLFIHMKVAESLMAVTGALPVNMKFIFEGEEEIGSGNLEKFVPENTDLLAADAVLISDTSFVAEGVPTIVSAVRGLCYMEFKITGPKRDLHSGQYGGTVYNPAQLVADIIASMHDEDGVVMIPGFYDKVRLLTHEERDSLFKVPYGLEEWGNETGLQLPWGEEDYTLLERIGARPTCEVNGIYGGFIEEGAKTVIPAKAGAKVSMRLVADQDPDEIARLFQVFVEAQVPVDYKVEIINHSGGDAMKTPIDAPEMEAASKAFETVYGKEAVFVPMGGSIPIAASFQKNLNAAVVFLGFGLDDNIHAPNEHFRVDQFNQGMQTIANFLFNLVD